MLTFCTVFYIFVQNIKKIKYHTLVQFNCFYCLCTLKFESKITAFYDRKVRTVPLTNPLHMGHLRKEGAHSLHTTR